MKAGIDLGTTYTLISQVSPTGGGAALIPDRHDINSHRTPSVVHISNDRCFVGVHADDLLEETPELPMIRLVKRNMGQSVPVFTDPSGMEWLPEEVSALILRKAMKDAEANGAPLTGAAIAVPAHFGDPERRATKHAGLLAGIPEVRLINEPEAAAWHYGQNHRSHDHTLLVYDLGGGTFDVTVLQAYPGGYEVLATDGKKHLGGVDFDNAIMQCAAESFQDEFGINPLEDLASTELLRRSCEELKIRLSRRGICQTRSSRVILGHPFEFIMTREFMDQLLTPFIEQTITICENCLQGAGLASWSSLDAILLAGGSSRLPLVHSMLGRASSFPNHKIRLDQPDMAVSYGAALMADQMLSDHPMTEQITFQQVTSHDLGIRVADPETKQFGVKVLIDKNSPLSEVRKVPFSTWHDNQTDVQFHFVQKCPDRELDLGSFCFGPIQSPQAGYPVSLEVTHDDEGMVVATAIDGHTGKEIRRVIRDEERATAQITLEQMRRIQRIPINE